MRLILFFYTIFFRFLFIFGQIEQEGNSCNTAMLLTDTILSAQILKPNGVTWYKFKSPAPAFSIRLSRLDNCIIYESTSLDFCSGLDNGNVVLALGDSLKNVNNKYIRSKAGELEGLCSCDNCMKTPLTVDHIKIKSDNTYYIQVIGSHPWELQFDKKIIKNENKHSLGKKEEEKSSCEIVFMKTYTDGSLIQSDGQENKSFSLKDLSALKYGLHIYFMKRDFSRQTFKVREYVLEEIASKCMLDSLLKYLMDNPGKNIMITGYVTKGEDKLAEKYEQIASESLALIVRNYLFDHKISLDRIKTEGKGSTQQLYENEKSRVSFIYELNRNNRVKIKVLN